MPHRSEQPDPPSLQGKLARGGGEVAARVEPKAALGGEWVSSDPDPPAHAIIVPFYNEAENVPSLLAEIASELSRLGASTQGGANHEVLLVDDGSTDATGSLLAQGCVARPGWRVLRFSRNAGQAAALYAGMRAARAGRLILLDGDGQNAPADIPALLALLDAGADLAVGVRARRQDHWGRRVASRVAKAVRRRLLGDGVRDTGCGLKAMRREVVGALIPIRTLYSFIPALAVAGGFRVAETEVSHRPRTGGRSHYSVRRFLGWPLLDLLGVWWFTHRRASVPGLTAAGNGSATVGGAAPGNVVPARLAGRLSVASGPPGPA